MAELSLADHSISPPRITIPREYNAAHDLIERNLRAGRSDKVAFIDDAGTCTYGRLAQRVDAFAHGSGGPRPPHGRACPLVPARHRRLPHRVSGQHQGRDHSDPGEHPAHGSRLRAHASRSRARALVVSAPLLPDFAPAARTSAAPRACHRVRRRRRRASAFRIAPRPLPRRLRRRPHDRATTPASGSTPRARPAPQGHGAPPGQPDPDRRALRAAGAGHPRGRRRVLRGQALLRLRPGQRAHLPDGGRRDRRADGGAADAGRRVRPLAEAPADDLLWRPDAVCGDARQRRPAAAGRAAPAPLHLRRRSAARPRSAGAGSARFGVDILDGIGSTEMLHIFLSNRPGDVRYGTTGRPVPGYELRLVDDERRAVAAGRAGRAADQRARRARRCTGTTARRPAPPSRAPGPAAATSTRTTPTAITSMRGGATTCSRWAACTSRRSRSKSALDHATRPCWKRRWSAARTTTGW